MKPRRIEEESKRQAETKEKKIQKEAERIARETYSSTFKLLQQQRIEEESKRQAETKKKKIQEEAERIARESSLFKLQQQQQQVAEEQRLTSQ